MRVQSTISFVSVMALVMAGALAASAQTPAAKPAAAGAAPAAADNGWVPGPKRIDPSAGILKQYKGTGTVPRDAAGHPDLTGLYGTGYPSPAGPYGRRGNDTFEPDQAVMQRGSAWNKPLYKPQFWSKVEGLDFSEVTVDSAFRCAPDGVPRIGIPRKIVQKGNEVWLYYGSVTRIIPVDGRKLTDDDQDQQTYNGVASGHWDGDVLVIDTPGYNDITWLRWQGYFHTENMTVRERLWRDGDILYWNATVTDPEVLAQPWTLDTYSSRLNRNQKAIPGEPGECKEFDSDKIVDRYFRG